MFNLTRQERTVLLFLGAVIFLGLGINFCLKKFPFIEDLYQNNICAVGQINLNRATYQDLVGIPNIGPALSAQIIEYRTKIGAFKNIEDLKNINGIGPKKYNQIKDFFSIDKQN